MVSAFVWFLVPENQPNCSGKMLKMKVAERGTYWNSTVPTADWLFRAFFSLFLPLKKSACYQTNKEQGYSSGMNSVYSLALYLSIGCRHRHRWKFERKISKSTRKNKSARLCVRKSSVKIQSILWAMASLMAAKAI